MTDTARRLVAAIHAEGGVGKSRLADTAPGPRVTLDAEGGATEWTPSPKAWWDPDGPLPTTLSYPPERAGEPIDTDTTVGVLVKDWTTVEKVYRVLVSGQHYFESWVWDSVTEIQDKCKRVMETQANGHQMWGKLLDGMANSVKEWRDLRVHPVKRMNGIIVGGTINKDGRQRFDVQGALIRKLPYLVDVIGYMVTAVGTDQLLHRTLAIQPTGPYDAKDRTDILTQRFGYSIADPDMRTIAAVLRGEI